MVKKGGRSAALRPTSRGWTVAAPASPSTEPDRPCEPAPDLAGLARSAAAGDRLAFHALVEATHAPIYRLALRTTGAADQAEDVLQETYVRAWSSLTRGPPPEAIQAWLFGVARHVAADWLRAHRRRSAGPVAALADAEALAALVADPRPGPRELCESAELSVAVRRAVEALPDRHRVVLLLREVDGLSYDELAAALGCPAGTVESRLFRARSALARRLAAVARRFDP